MGHQEPPLLSAICMDIGRGDGCNDTPAIAGASAGAEYLPERYCAKSYIRARTSKVRLAVSRDRAGTFAPQLIAKIRHRRLARHLISAVEQPAKFWLRVMNELNGRGASDLIAVVDRLKAFQRQSTRIPADHGADLHRPSHPSFDVFFA
jgi:hypothetical protein